MGKGRRRARPGQAKRYHALHTNVLHYDVLPVACSRGAKGRTPGKLPSPWCITQCLQPYTPAGSEQVVVGYTRLITQYLGVTVQVQGSPPLSTRTDGAAGSEFSFMGRTLPAAAACSLSPDPDAW